LLNSFFLSTNMVWVFTSNIGRIAFFSNWELTAITLDGGISLHGSDSSTLFGVGWSWETVFPGLPPRVIVVSALRALDSQPNKQQTKKRHVQNRGFGSIG
ncbi:hypothetical protein, partial [Lunatimonas lonarensis]|uniref:hypothetical protein n=1 Tax=Lunatimonas lonarensis TaxID=1232681 RepID=UPI0005628FFF